MCYKTSFMYSPTIFKRLVGILEIIWDNPPPYFSLNKIQLPVSEEGLNFPDINLFHKAYILAGIKTKLMPVVFKCLLELCKAHVEKLRKYGLGN